jgi:hypothetical protein
MLLTLLVLILNKHTLLYTSGAHLAAKRDGGDTMMNLAQAEYKSGSREDLILKRMKYEMKRNADGRCPSCGKRGCTDLQLHHVLPRHTNPESSADSKNMVILCKACHAELHKKYVKHEAIVKAAVAGKRARLTGTLNKLGVPNIEFV